MQIADWVVIVADVCWFPQVSQPRLHTTHQDVAVAGSSLGVASLGCGHQHMQKQGHYVNWAKCCKIRDDILVFYCPALPD